MVGQETSTALHVAREAAVELRRCSLEAIEALHAAIPKLEPALRRTALGAKRDAHNGRRPSIGATGIAAIAESAGAKVGEALERWVLVHRDLAKALEELESAPPLDVEVRLRPALARVAKTEAFLRPLALAAPGLVGGLEGAHSAGPNSLRASKLDRTLLLYWMRATTKTSPFSTFMYTGLAIPSEIEPGHVRRRRLSITRTNPAIATLLLDAAVTSGNADGVPLLVNPSLHALDGGRVQASVPSYVIALGRLWRSERQAMVRVAPRVIAALWSLPPTFDGADLLAALERSGLQESEARAVRAKLLGAHFVICSFEQATRHLESEHRPGLDESLEGVAGALRQMRRAAARLPNAAARERLDLSNATRAGVERIGQSLRVSERMSEIPLFFEDGVEAEVEQLDSSTWSLALETARALERRIVVRPSFARLRDSFVREFGVGGDCADVPGFLEQVHASLAAEQAPARPPPRSSWGRAPPGARALSTVLFQGSELPGVTGAYAIINQVSPGVGWLSARYASLGPWGGKLGELLAGWLAAAAGNAEPVEVPVCPECSPLQVHPQLMRRSLRWGTEPSLGSGSIEPSRLTLHHDPSSDGLTLRDRSGLEICPIYLGASLPTPGWGLPYWLTILGAPYGVLHESSPWTLPRGDVEILPRCIEGRVVLRRGTWVISAQYVLDRWLRGSPARRLFEVALDRERLAMPRWLFVRAIPDPTRTPTLDGHKPIWLDTENTFCLDILESMARGATALSFAEALPAPGVDKGHHATEFLVEMALTSQGASEPESAGEEQGSSPPTRGS